MAIEGHLERGVQHRRLQAAVHVQGPAGPVALVPRLGLGAGSSVAGRCPRDVGEGHTRAAAMTVTQFAPPPSTLVCAVPASFTVPSGQPSSDPLQPGQSSCR